MRYGDFLVRNERMNLQGNMKNINIFNWNKYKIFLKNAAC